MKNVLWILTLTSVSQLTAQELYNNGAVISISSGATIQVNGNFTNTSAGTLTNNGTLRLTGNLNNAQVMSVYQNGTLSFIGTAMQTISGAADFWTQHLAVNNPAGITLNRTIKINGNASFNNGIVNAGATTPMWFTSSGNAVGATDASHVNGYVVREGTGIFTYPVGDGSRYQKIDINPAANATGIRVKYNPFDAGHAPSSTPLLYYNKYEHWEVAPLSTASGTVTVHWDDYLNTGINSASDLVVAHYIGGSWKSEGAASRTGNTSAGSVTSNTVSNWSPFTLGSVSSNSILPLTWLLFNGSMSAGKTELRWKVSEQQVVSYEVQKSVHKENFHGIAIINSKGDGENNYVYVDAAVSQQAASYRIKQTDRDGKFSYSEVVRVAPGPENWLHIYPSPFSESLRITSPIQQMAQLLTVDGRIVRTVRLQPGSNVLNTADLQSGPYIIYTLTGSINVVKK